MNEKEALEVIEQLASRALDPELDESIDKIFAEDFSSELRQLLNKYSIDAHLNTPDFVLAPMLQSTLSNYHSTVNAAKNWEGPPETYNFYVTFAQNHLNNPRYPQANAGGWVRIVAEDETQALDLAGKTFGNRYAYLYTEDRWDPSYFPEGEIEVMYAWW